VPNWISLKTRLKVEMGVTESWELPEFWESNDRTYRNVYFFMLSCSIFETSVDRGIPSLAAAPLALRLFRFAFRKSRFNEFLLIALEILC